jgi:hypothetical protein
MATPVSLANVARVAVGIVTLVWALLGLGNALAAGMGRTVDLTVVAGVIVNCLLLAAAVLAFARGRYWYASIIAATVLVTIDRLLGAFGSGDWWLGLTNVAMLLAVFGIATVGRER